MKKVILKIVLLTTEGTHRKEFLVVLCRQLLQLHYEL